MILLNSGMRVTDQNGMIRQGLSAQPAQTLRALAGLPNFRSFPYRVVDLTTPLNYGNKALEWGFS